MPGLYFFSVTTTLFILFGIIFQTTTSFTFSRCSLALNTPKHAVPTSYPFVSSVITSRSRRLSISNLNVEDDDVARQLAEAKNLLAKTKSEIAAKVDEKKKQKNDEGKENRVAEKRSQVIKSRTESGLFTTDGGAMADLSEEEEWEVKQVLDVFEKEKQEGEVTRQEINMERDIAMQMFNLRKSMQDPDYEKIFDKKNLFIGDE